MALDIHDLINAHIKLAVDAPDMPPDEWVSDALNLLLRLQHSLDQEDFAALNGLIVIAAKRYYLAEMSDASRQIKAIDVADAIISKMKGHD